MRPLEDFSGLLAQRVYASLREASLSMFFRPGDILRKPKICTQSGVPRSPVFEAVTRLAVEHLVRTVPQSGTYVARFSLAEIREGAFLPEALELVTLELATMEKAAQTITDDGVGQLHRNLSLQKTCWKSTISIVFIKITPPCICLSCLLAVLLGPRPWPIPLGSIVEHHAIFAAIGTRNPVAARAATCLHLGQLVGFLEPLALARPDLCEPD